MTYATIQDVKEEFKAIDIGSETVLKAAQLARFLLEADASINSYLGTRYVVPLTGTISVKQSEKVTVTTVVDSTLYTVSINGKDALFTSGVAATATQIRDGLKAAILALGEPVTVVNSSASEFLVNSEVAGFSFTISVDANLTLLQITANVKGTDSLDLMRSIEINFVACRIAKILKIKVNNDEFTKQESTHCEAAKDSLKLLKDISAGIIKLPDAVPLSSGGGLSDYNSKTPWSRLSIKTSISGDMAGNDKSSGEKFLTYSLENWATFQKQLDEASKKHKTLKPAMALIADDFYKSEKAIFRLSSPGAYDDLSPKYKKRKQKEVGFLYPILKRKGALERSVTEWGAPGNVTIVGDRFVIVGTKVPYAAAQQFGVPSRNLPSRPFLFLGPESARFQSADRAGLGGRLTRWTNIIDGYSQAVINSTLETV